MSKGIGGEIVMEDDEPETDPAGTPGPTGDKAGEQSTKIVAVDESGADTVTTPEQNERDALILKLVGLIAKNLIDQNPSSEALTRVIDGRLSAIISAVGGIVLEEEPQVPNPTTVQVNIEEPFVSQK